MISASMGFHDYKVKQWLTNHWKVFNPLTSKSFGCHLKSFISKLISLTDILSMLSEIALTWMPQDLTGDWLKLVQVMAWYHQATSHYLNQPWPNSMTPYVITIPQYIYLIPWSPDIDVSILWPCLPIKCACRIVTVDMGIHKQPLTLAIGKFNIHLQEGQTPSLVLSGNGPGLFQYKDAMMLPV